MVAKPQQLLAIHESSLTRLSLGGVDQPQDHSLAFEEEGQGQMEHPNRGVVAGGPGPRAVADPAIRLDAEPCPVEGTAPLRREAPTPRYVGKYLDIALSPSSLIEALDHMEFHHQSPSLGGV